MPGKASFHGVDHFDLAADLDEQYDPHLTNADSSQVHSHKAAASSEDQRPHSSRGSQRNIRSSTSPAPGSHRSGSRSPSAGPYERSLKVRNSHLDKRSSKSSSVSVQHGEDLAESVVVPSAPQPSDGGPDPGHCVGDTLQAH